MLNYYRLAVLLLFSASASAQLPVINVVTTNTAFCTGKPISFSVTTNGPILSYSWSVFPTKDVTISNPTGSNFTATFPKDLTYTVSVEVQATDGPVKARKIVPIARTAVAAFNASLNATGIPNDLQLTNYSSFSSKNYWLFSDDAVRDSSTNTVKSYTAAGLYNVTLVALGTRGCNDTLIYTLPLVGASTLTLPNVFSPNGDGVNEIYKPIGTGISALKGHIFTREGIVLYEWSTPEGYWDGRTFSGEPCENGQYPVVVEATGFDGKVYNLHTMVTLFR